MCQSFQLIAVARLVSALMSLFDDIALKEELTFGWDFNMELVVLEIRVVSLEVFKL